MYAPSNRPTTQPAPSDTTISMPAPPARKAHNLMQVVCHGCKQPARPQDEDKCSHCGKWLVTRADLKIWSITRSIAVMAILAFALFCWLAGVHCTNNTVLTTFACVALPMIMTQWLMKSQAPDWMHGITYNEISVGVAFGLGLPVAAFCIHMMGPTKPEGLTYWVPHRQSSIGYIIQPGETSPATTNNKPQIQIKSVPTETDTLGGAAADLMTSLASNADDLRSELDTANVRKVIYPASLADLKRVKAARSRIQKLDAHVTSVDASRRSALAEFPANVNSATTLSQKQKAELLARARSSAGLVVKRWTEFVALERKLLQETNATLAVVESAGSSRYAVENKQILFAREADFKSFDQHQKHLADLWTQLDNTVRMLRAASEDASKSLKSLP